MTDRKVTHKLIASIVGDQHIRYLIGGTGVNTRFGAAIS